MNVSVSYAVNSASAEQVAEHLRHCDVDFSPLLSGRVVIDQYAQKILAQAQRFEAWMMGDLVGLVACYCNDTTTRTAFVTSVSVSRECRRRGIASALLRQCIDYVARMGMIKVLLEVSPDNAKAIRLYEGSGWIVKTGESPVAIIERDISQNGRNSP
jgi:ribosomal protein S18 acetylase RimI-like enzyme